MWHLLPLLSGAVAPAPVHAETNAELTARLVAAARADVRAGWQVVASYDDRPGIRLVKDGVAMRHELVIDEDGEGGMLTVSVRADTGEHARDSNLADAVVRGGVSLESHCGDWNLEPYVIDATASGAAAGALVGRVLARADDLEDAWDADRTITFVLEDQGHGYHLVAELDDADRIARATLRRIAYVHDESAYARANRMRTTLRGKAVTAIVDKQGGLELVLDGKARFAIDPDNKAFVSHPRDEDEGCGC